MNETLFAWLRTTARQVPPGLEVWDAHTHTGWNDPDGRKQRADELLAALDAAGHRGAVIMSNQDPIGYRAANDRILDESENSNGRLIPYLRVDPTDSEALHEARRSIEAGHRGIKLHPRAEQFALSDRGVHRIADVAASAGVPFIVHSGRGIDHLITDALDLLQRHPGLEIVFAHAGISDLPRLAAAVPYHRGILFDTSWWMPVDLGALFAWVPASRILYASDAPYGHPVTSSIITARAAMEAGIRGEDLAAVFGLNLQRVLSRGEPDDSRKGHRPALDLWTSRVLSYVLGTITTLRAGGDPAEPMSLALAACDAPDAEYPEVLAAIGATLAASEKAEGRDRFDLLVVAASACATPRVGVPDLG